VALNSPGSEQQPDTALQSSTGERCARLPRSWPDRIDARDKSLVIIVAVCRTAPREEEVAHLVDGRIDRKMKGSTTLPSDFDIFSPRPEQKAVGIDALLHGNARDIRNAGQYTA